MTLVRRPSPFSEFVTPCRTMDHLSATRGKASVVEVGVTPVAHPARA
ncbi:MAG: hypothetical protein ACYC65_06025 [Candidatus Limnocylindrales bacterium]